MPISLHHCLRIAAGAVFMIGGLAIMLVLGEKRPLAGYLIGFISFCFGMFLPKLIEKYVPAACPKCNGPSYAFISDEKMLCFECTRCGYVHKTKFDESPSDSAS